VIFPPIKIARNQEFCLSTLHTKNQIPKAIARQNAYMTVYFDPSFDQSNESLGLIGIETKL